MVYSSNCVSKPFVTSDWLICDQGQGREKIFQRFLSIIKRADILYAYLWNLHICMIMQERCIWKRRESDISSPLIICDQGQGRATIFQRFLPCIHLHSSFCTHISEICIFVWWCRRGAFEIGGRGTIWSISLFVFLWRGIDAGLPSKTPKQHYPLTFILNISLPTFTK